VLNIHKVPLQGSYSVPAESVFWQFIATLGFIKDALAMRYKDPKVEIFFIFEKNLPMIMLDITHHTGCGNIGEASAYSLGHTTLISSAANMDPLFNSFPSKVKNSERGWI
jgi:hypothetical protein